MSEFFSPENINEWKSFEEKLLNIEGKTMESFQLEVLDRSIEEFNSIYQQDPVKLDGITMSTENYKYQMLMRKDISVKIENVVSKDEAKNLSNKEKVAMGKPFVYEGMLKNYESYWSNPNIKKNILKYCAEFIIRNLSSLSCRGPSRKLLFSTTDQTNFFQACKVDTKVVKDLIKKSEAIEPSWALANEPMYMTLSSLIAYYYHNQTLEEKKIKDLEKTIPYQITLFASVRIYSFLQHKYFKHGADDEEMNAAIENMSSRFLFKGMKNVLELLKYITYTQCEGFISRLDNPVDFNLYYYINNLTSRLNYMIKTIANEFYEYREMNKGVSIQDMQRDNPDSGDKYLTLPESISNDIAIITRKLLIKFASETDIDDFCLTLACKQTGGPKEKIRVALLNMKNNDSALLGRLINNMLAYYLGTLKQKKNTIKSSKFITLMKKVNAISNTIDPFVLDIKATLDLLLERNSEDFRKTSRKATLSVLRSTIYFFMVFYICKFSE